ncbi:hypothetical protein [Actinotalea fermentans]|uniref:Uncharacterized protein n=1 Tax=Actinotalea fermentans TaxID=43671 RepID=A0A511Z2B9_9CELL|nr:hypothetical protein [Actinotalea fermentans]KGM17711.1 hypothetical protein N867_15310 [Actinotalea fermentans ATCC 43279 = JCM 9966 = DSM 3133]GEN81602.1 hypothetical protein AFE02nite_33360 [Actinotalea fermentans]
MLHQDVLMADIDVDQWRNAQALLLRSAKAARRLVVIHEDGDVVKFRHTSGATCVGAVERVNEPRALAQRLYEANRESVDFVVVMERGAVDSYFAALQDSWNIDEDLDVFVQRTYALLDEYPEGVVTYPGPARDILGLQWRTGASLDAVNAAARALVAPGSTVVLGVHDSGSLWASLVLDFDDEWKVTSITTADPSLVDVTGAIGPVLNRVVAWQESRGKKVSLALSMDRTGAEEFLAAPAAEKAGVLGRLVSAGRAARRP